MKKSLLYDSVIILAIAALLNTQISCTKTQFSPLIFTTGTANFTTFISVGNSLTQGYMDGGLYHYGQSNSYPSIIAQQVQLAFPSMPAYSQPAVAGNGSGYIHLVYLNNQITPIQPGDDSTAGANPCDADPSWKTWGESLQGNFYNNLGIAGIRLTDAVGLNTTEKQNNFLICHNNPYGRYMNFGNISEPVQYIDHIRTCKATFFTCWLGNNDVLLYAVNGGVVNYALGIPENNITAPAEFAQKYDSILTVFHNLGAKGVCATIPNVTSIPYFNTVPSYVTVNGAKQYLWITTATGVRQATDGDYIVLPEYNNVVAGQGLYESNPVPNNLVLDASEVDSVQTATNAYNASINSIASSFGYPVADMHAYLITLQSSITVDGITLTPQYVQGGAFGLDGVHPTARGYALIANKFISTINAAYGATIPPVAVSNYRGVLFPNY